MIEPQSLVNTKLAIGPQALLYECPNGKTATIKSFSCMNKHTGFVTINIYKKDGVSSKISELITPNLPLDQNESVIEDRVIMLNPTDRLLGDATVAGVVTCEVNGFENDAP